VDVCGELQIVRLDRIEKRAQKAFDRAARNNNVPRMSRAAKLETAAHNRAVAIVTAPVRPFSTFT
jgi:hypothetical protein